MQVMGPGFLIDSTLARSDGCYRTMHRSWWRVAAWASESSDVPSGSIGALKGPSYPQATSGWLDPPKHTPTPGRTEKEGTARSPRG